ncbi:MAG: hypothetical protein HY897_25105 [Deltaproteobacteria bacterium]|nr:hypothetical protein [Deltaproteobacteria bacterium]
MICPKCGSDKVYPSRLKSDNEFFIVIITNFDPYRCMTCRRRFWRFRWRPRRKQGGGFGFPDVGGELKRLSRSIKEFWPQNRGRMIPLVLKMLLIGALAVGIATIIGYSTGKMKSQPDFAKPTEAAKR